MQAVIVTARSPDEHSHTHTCHPTDRRPSDVACATGRTPPAQTARRPLGPARGAPPDRDAARTGRRRRARRMGAGRLVRSGRSWWPRVGDGVRPAHGRGLPGHRCLPGRCGRAGRWWTGDGAVAARPAQPRPHLARAARGARPTGAVVSGPARADDGGARPDLLERRTDAWQAGGRRAARRRATCRHRPAGPLPSRAA